MEGGGGGGGKKERGVILSLDWGGNLLLPVTEQMETLAIIDCMVSWRMWSGPQSD